MAINSLGVLATVCAVNASLDSALHSMSEFTAVGGRAQVVEIPIGSGTALLIDDSFNATPDSVRATLKLLAEYGPQRQARRIAVLGDILHLGPASQDLHSSLAEDICLRPIHQVFTIGSEMLHLHRALPHAIRGPHASCLRELEQLVRAYLQAGDILTIKASTPIGLGRLAASLKSSTRHSDS